MGQWDYPIYTIFDKIDLGDVGLDLNTGESFYYWPTTVDESTAKTFDGTFIMRPYSQSNEHSENNDNSNLQSHATNNKKTTTMGTTNNKKKQQLWVLLIIKKQQLWVLLIIKKQQLLQRLGKQLVTNGRQIVNGL